MQTLSSETCVSRRGHGQGLPGSHSISPTPSRSISQGCMSTTCYSPFLEDSWEDRLAGGDKQPRPGTFDTQSHSGMPAVGGTLAGKLGWAVVPPMQGSKATHPVENKVAMLLSYVGSLVGQRLCPQGKAQETNSNGMRSPAEITLSQG